MNQQHRMSEAMRRRFADLAECFDRPCIVDSPMLAQELLGRNVAATGFTDEPGFADLPGFRHWSLNAPVYVADEFDFVFVLLDDQTRGPELFHALRVICHFHFDTAVVLAAPSGTGGRPVSALEPFGVQLRESTDDLVVWSNFELP